MNYIGNLSDVMMILAVGIMLALILHWKVPISTAESEEQPSDRQTAVEFSRDDLETAPELPENMEKTGEVYYDAESGSYYIVYGS
jgi:hypothetical protein